MINQSYKISKTAFSLIELIISIVLISLMFGIYVFYNKKDLNFNTKVINLKSLKNDLIEKYTFNNSLKAVCIKRNLECYVLIDGLVNKKIPIENLFNEKPLVYKYDRELQPITNYYLTFENDEVEEVIFEFSIDSDLKTNELIVFSDEQYYIFNALNLNPTILKEEYEIFNMFEEYYIKAKNAFLI